MDLEAERIQQKVRKGTGDGGPPEALESPRTRNSWAVGEVHSFHRRRRFFFENNSLVEVGQTSPPFSQRQPRPWQEWRENKESQRMIERPALGGGSERREREKPEDVNHDGGDRMTLERR